MSHYIWKMLCEALLVPNGWLKCKINSFNCHFPEHRVITYNDSESIKGENAHSGSSHPDDTSEPPQRTSHSNRQVSTGNTANIDDMQEAQLKLSRFLSDPGPNKWGFRDEAYL